MHRDQLPSRRAALTGVGAALTAALAAAPAASAAPRGTLRRAAGTPAAPGTPTSAPVTTTTSTTSSTGTAGAPTASAAAGALAGPRSGLPWVSGAFTEHSTAKLAAFEAGRGRRLDAAAVFTSRSSTAAGLNTWWLDAARPVTSAGGWLLLAVPLWNEDQSLASDTRPFWDGLGAALVRAGVAQRTLVRLGWEMNLPGWAHRVTPANRTAWTAAFAAAASRLRAAAPGVSIAFNPNEGNDQTGVPMADLAHDLLGSYDFVGPDSYNWYPVVNDQTTWDQVYRRAGGLKQWEDFARANGKGFTLPEWGGYPGASAGRGSDGALYATQVVARFRALAAQGVPVVESYFNESDPYIANSLWSPTQMPALAAAYRAALA